jgi:hypothetical protein
MAGKGKKKKKGDDGPKEPPKIIIPDYTPPNLQPLPMSVKVKHSKDIYIKYIPFRRILTSIDVIIYCFVC